MFILFRSTVFQKIVLARFTEDNGPTRPVTELGRGSLTAASCEPSKSPQAA